MLNENRYCHLQTVGSEKISSTYTLIDAGFRKVQEDIDRISLQQGQSVSSLYLGNTIEGFEETISFQLAPI